MRSTATCLPGTGTASHSSGLLAWHCTVSLSCTTREGNEPTAEATITYAQLLNRVKKFANALRLKGLCHIDSCISLNAAAGIGKGDNVAIYLPMVPEILVAMFACARIGAPHSIIVCYKHDRIRQLISS